MIRDPSADEITAMARDVVTGSRRALAKAITLIESTRSDDRPRIESLLEALLPASGNSIRIGITGVP